MIVHEVKIYLMARYYMGLVAKKPVSGHAQTSLLSYRDKVENCNFSYSKFIYGTFELANMKGADQPVRMRRLVCAFVVCKPPRVEAHMV